MEIILVDDNPDHRLILKHRLNELFEESRVNDFSDASECLAYIEKKEKAPDMVVSDLFLEDSMDGMDLFLELQKRKVSSKFILVSSDQSALVKKSRYLRSQDRYFVKSNFLKENPETLRNELRG